MGTDALTSADILAGLQIAIAVMVIVLIYHLLFIAVDVRKVLRRVNELTESVEEMLLKPISMVDQLLQWSVETIQENEKKKAKKVAKKKSSGKKGRDKK